ncbi:hypothetical protein [Rhodococcus sp. ABRD24]|uniref:hypothetical protein n=1 Tax=Rhodococcus sp. ABRD24 TaxID=2507582 RepID=UPI001F602B64|nr:hypothetical protein [Rhodococcus sp. ABRD24]
MTSGEPRPRWQVPAPPGGWGPPWPQAAELAQAIPSQQWSLVGGLMVQVHAARAGLPIGRATVDVDMVLHIETGATTFSGIRERLEQLDYRLRMPVGDGPAHRFVREHEHVDVMVADNLAPTHRPTVHGRAVFALPAGTSALRKTVDCRIDVDGAAVQLSVPDALGALVLKGAAYREDARDRGRHLEDAAVLACTLDNPVLERDRMIGSDRKRIRYLAAALERADHPAWSAVPAARRGRGHAALQVLAKAPTPLPPDLLGGLSAAALAHPTRPRRSRSAGPAPADPQQTQGLEPPSPDTGIEL